MKRVKQIAGRRARKQQNRHARSRQKRQALRLKNFFAHVANERSQKRMAQLKPKGTPVIGMRAVEVAAYQEWKENETSRYPNQRQKRKKWRQNPHLRRAA